MIPKLSIITICYNDLNGLKVTIPSVLSQNYRDYEWIIIDGASSDGSKEYIDDTVNYINANVDFGQMRVVWKSEPDTGIYNAMNKGVSYASGHYCLFLNAGDIFCSPKSLERAFKQTWKADIVSCDEFIIGSKWCWDYIQAPRQVTFHRILKGYLPHQTTFIRRELLIKYPYREDYSIVADWAFWWDVLITNNFTYQHLAFPLAAFDCTGVSSTNYVKNKEERVRFLLNYIRDIQVLEKITDECLLNKTIEGDFLYNSERTFLKLVILCVRRVYVHIIGPIHKLYVNFRWRK